MTNFRKKLIKYYNYLKENMKINLLFLITSILSTYLLITAFDNNVEILGYAAVTGFNFSVMLIPMIIAEIKGFKNNIKNIIILYLKFIISVALIGIASFSLIYLSIAATQAVFLTVNTVTRFANNISFILALYLGLEGLILFLTAPIIIVYLFFKKMTILNCIKYSRKFTKKRILSHFLNCIGVVLLGAPILYSASKFDLTSILFSIFCISYFTLVFTYIIFDIKDELDYIDEIFKIDAEKKKQKTPLWKSIKNIYIREKTEIIDAIKKKFNNNLTNEGKNNTNTKKSNRKLNKKEK